MSILAQIIGLACLLFWGFWLCCKLRLPAGFAPLCGLCFCMVVLQLAGSCNQLWLGAQLLLVGAVLTLAQRRRHEILPQLLSPGVLAFCSAAGVLMAVFAIRQPEFQTWDEFSHWGIYFKSVFYQHRFAVWDTTRSLAHQAYPQGLPGLYALFALPAAQYREADVLFVTALPLAAAASALFALPQVTARRPRIAYTVCACLAAPALFWLFAPDTPYTTAYMDAPVGALFAAALCVILLPCAANSRVQRGLALAFLCGALTTVKEIGTVFALCVVGIWFLQCLLDALRDKGGILRGFLLPFTAALPCFAIPLAWKLLLKALHRADDQFSSMGPGYFLQCWQEARTGFDRYFYDVWDRYYARLRSYPLLFGASTFKVGCLCAAAAVLLLIVLIWAMGRWQGLRTALPGLLRLFHRQKFLSPRRGTAHVSAQRRQARVKAVVPAVNIPVVEKLGRALGAKPGHEHGRAAAQVACRERRAGEPLDAGDIRHTALDADGCAQTPEFLGMTVTVGKDVFGEHRGALCPQAGRHERRLRIRGKARIRLRDDRTRRRELSIR